MPSLGRVLSPLRPSENRLLANPGKSGKMYPPGVALTPVQTPPFTLILLPVKFSSQPISLRSLKSHGSPSSSVAKSSPSFTLTGLTGLVILRDCENALLVKKTVTKKNPVFTII